MYRTDFWTLWEKARVGCFKRTASKHVYCLGWNRSPDQVAWMRQALGPGVLGRPREIGWRGRWEGGLGWETHVNPWLIHFNVWQNPLQYCKVISLQLINKQTNKQKKKGRQAWYKRCNAGVCPQPLGSPATITLEGHQSVILLFTSGSRTLHKGIKISHLSSDLPLKSKNFEGETKK